MNITIKECRKLLAELKKKYKMDCSVTLAFNSYSDNGSDGYINVYVNGFKDCSCTKKFFDAKTIRKAYKLK